MRGNIKAENHITAEPTILGEINNNRVNSRRIEVHDLGLSTHTGQDPKLDQINWKMKKEEGERERKIFKDEIVNSHFGL